MSGRPKKQYEQQYREVSIDIGFKHCLTFATILVLCPVCQSPLIGTNGTKNRKYDRVEIFQCKNPHCSFIKERDTNGKLKHKQGKQFQLTSSYRFKTEIWALLTDFYSDLVKDGAKARTIAKKYHISPSLVSILRRELEDAIDSHSGLEHLVDIPLSDNAVAMDETFLKIAGKAIYIIIATGYTTHKTLGLKVSETRKVEDLQEVFEEAQNNIQGEIELISSDAWGGYSSLCKNQNREITLVMHKHKKPYDKAVIRHYTYTDTERIITNIGVKTDVFKKKAKKEYHYKEIRESLIPIQKNPVGRPKGVKNGQGKKKNTAKPPAKRGRKGIFGVFKTGKRGYMWIDPYKKALKLGKGCLGTVASALNKTFVIYAHKSIQNNLAENINSVLQSLIRLRGPKTIESVEKRLRAVLIVRNNPTILQEIQIDRNMRGVFLLKNIEVANYSRMIESEWEINGVQKKGVLAD